MPLLACSNRPMRRAVAPGECALLVSEEFALQQCFRDGDTIHNDKRLLGAIAVLVKRAGDKFLARARLATDEDRDGPGGETADFLVNGLDGAAVADDRVGASGGVSQFDGFRDEPAARHRLVNQVEQLGGVKRLEQIVVCAQLGGLDGGLGRVVRRHQDDGQLRFGGADAVDEFETHFVA